MKLCLYCHSTFYDTVSWKGFLGINEESNICTTCEERLTPIEGPICEKCGRPLAHLDNNFIIDTYCSDCLRWERQLQWRGLLHKNRSLYTYSAFLQEVIAKYKYRGDAALAELFHASLKRVYTNEFHHYLLVPIPLSTEREYERGFNQAQLLAQGIGPTVPALAIQTNEAKQSKKTRGERMLTERPFVFNEVVKNQIKNADILIIDDIYTTGATVRAAAKLLKEQGAQTVSSLTLCR